MLITNPLDGILGQASKVSILRFLATTNAELNGREIAVAVGLSHVKVHTALKELSKHGVVIMRRSGKSILYRLNLNNVLVKDLLLPLFEEEAKIGEALKEIISKHLKRPKPTSAILFGSFATGNAKPDSDLDVLIVASNKRDIPMLNEALEKVEEIITASFGNQLAPIVMSKKEFKEKFKNKDKLITNITREGRVIFGNTINDLIKSYD